MAENIDVDYSNTKALYTLLFLLAVSGKSWKKTLIDIRQTKHALLKWSHGILKLVNLFETVSSVLLFWKCEVLICLFVLLLLWSFVSQRADTAASSVEWRVGCTGGEKTQPQVIHGVHRNINKVYCLSH